MFAALQGFGFRRRITSFPRRRESILCRGARKKVPETRNEPERPLRINKPSFAFARTQGESLGDSHSRVGGNPFGAGSAGPAFGPAAFQAGIASFGGNRQSKACRKEWLEMRNEPEKPFRINKPSFGFARTQGERWAAVIPAYAGINFKRMAREKTPETRDEPEQPFRISKAVF